MWKGGGYSEGEVGVWRPTGRNRLDGVSILPALLHCGLAVNFSSTPH